MPGQGMCNRILHSQKKQGRAFGVAPQVLDAAGQTFAEALHIKVRVDVVADVPQTRPKIPQQSSSRVASSAPPRKNTSSNEFDGLEPRWSQVQIKEAASDLRLGLKS